MATERVRKTSRWKRFAAGIALTALVSALYLLPEVHDVIEPRVQDVLLWQRRPAQPAAPEITVVEIDDGALGRIEKWPWSWDVLADVVDSLADLGARAIVLDITFTERPEEKLRRGSLAEYPDGTPWPGDAFRVRVDPLPMLVDAVRRSQRTVLTYSVVTGSLVDDPLYRSVEALLAESPALSAAEVAGRLGRPEADVARFFVTARERALEIFLSRRTPVAPDDEEAAAKVFAEVAPGLDYAADMESPERKVFDDALSRVWAAARLAERGPIACDALVGPGDLKEAQGATPPLADLTDAAAALGFANVVPDADGVVRRVPLLVAHDGKVYPQLGLAAALLALGGRCAPVRRTDDHRLEIVCGDGRVVRVPVGPRAQMTINWSRAREGRKDGYRHLPIRPIHEYSLLLKSQRVYEQAMTFAAELLLKPPARDAVLRELDETGRSGKGYGEITDRQGDLAFQLLKFAGSPCPDAMSERRYQQARAYANFLQRYLGQGEEQFKRIAAQRDQLKALLDDAVRDRLCFVGMTATGAALDFNPTPLERKYPGVFAHAAVADNLLRRSFASEPGGAVRLAMVLLVGLAVTLFAGWLPTVRATAASLAACAAYYGLCLFAFARAGVLMPVAGPWAAGGVSLLGVMIYRELTEGRNRRWITGVFKQYTSDKMVNELVANPKFLVLGGQRRDMTVYFSDIAGFTGLSERLDPTQLVAFLQTYLEEMTDRLLEQGATLDKYEGDAILAFFGAPLAQSDHAARCLRAALAHLRALPRVDARLKAEGLMPDGRDLRIRIGLSSGAMVVGNFGSTRRFDYTVIGDAVNVGARLEGANRFFGTTVLLSGATRDLIGDEFLLRRIGPVRFVGKDEAVDVYELLDDQAPDARAGLDDYAAGIEEFDGGWLNEARARFEAALEARPGDGPTQAYLARIDTLLRDGIHAATGPWDMTEK